MASHLGDYLRSRREAAGLRIVDVARIAGLKDSPKMLRRLEGLERTGTTSPEVPEAVMAVLDLDPSELEVTHQQDIAAYERWLDEPIQMELTVRMMPAVYVTQKVPEDLDRPQAIAWALEHARQQPRFKSCLRLSRQERVWISEGGSSYSVETIGHGDADQPYMRLKRPFRFIKQPKPESS